MARSPNLPRSALALSLGYPSEEALNAAIRRADADLETGRIWGRLEARDREAIRKYSLSAEHQELLAFVKAAGKREEKRRERAKKDTKKRLDDFKAKIWPKLRPHYGHRGWREVAHLLCLGAWSTWGNDDRALDRLLQKARNAGLVQSLRAPKHSRS